MVETVLASSHVSHDVNPVSLRTLGGLELSGSDFARPKPLLLLAYLAIEGPQERRHLAELFWPGNADGLNSLSVTLSRIRRGAKDALEADEVRVWTRLETDTQALYKALEAQNLEEALAHYKGAFLDGVYLSDWGAELEEWVYAQREALAAKARSARVALAEQSAQQGRFEAAARHAEAAYLLQGAPPLEPEDLRRLYPLLLAGKSGQAARIRQEAAELGLTLNLRAEEAKARFRRELLGRAEELQTLGALPEGSWAWVHGGAGMGKTALLKALPGHYLQARSGLPYATLEPLLGGDLSEGEGVLLRRLARLEDTLLVDGWEGADPESQSLLTRLRGLKPALRVIVASREAPSLEADLLLELGPLTAKALEAHPGAWEATGGLPALVEAYLRGKPLSTALDTRLAALHGAAREVGLSAPVMAAALDELTASGLIEPSGAVRPRQSVLEWLEGRRTLGARLALELARQKEGVEAFPLWQRAKLLWEEADTPKVQESYLAWGTQLLRRGFPDKAASLLDEVKANDHIIFLKAQIFEQLGRHGTAIEILEHTLQTPKVLSLKSALYWSLGKPQEARRAAEKALEENPLQAEALNTFGKLCVSAGDYQTAINYFRKAAVIWQTENETGEYADMLDNIAYCLCELGQPVETAFADALKFAEESLLIKARVILHMGIAYRKAKQYSKAHQCFLSVINISEESGDIPVRSRAFNSLGVLYEEQGEQSKASEAYEQALLYAQQLSEVYMKALILGNLSQLHGDIESLDQAIQLLESGGYITDAKGFRKIRAAMGA